MHSTPKILMGVFGFSGAGFETAALLDPGLRYSVPSDRRAQIIYLRAGNSSDGLIVLTVTRNGLPMRLFPIGAKASTHVPLAMLEDLEPDAELEVLVAASPGIEGHVAIDLGLIEI